MILDTTAYSALLRDHTGVATALQTAQALVMPLPVIGELRYGFAKGSRQQENERKLTRFLAQPHVSVAGLTMSTTEQFAELFVYAQRRGKALSHNDLWIAAVAQEIDERLVTLDNDFAVFAPLMEERLVLLKPE